MSDDTALGARNTGPGTFLPSTGEHHMRQIKLFKGIEAEASVLEREVNAWIREGRVQVVRITGNISPQSSGPATKDRFAPSDLLIIVEYEVDA
jgi:hypothetical protein